MSGRIYRYLAVVVAVIACVLLYAGKRVGWYEDLMFPTWLSILVCILIAASMLWILYRTIKGKPAERRIVFLYVGIAVSLPLLMTISLHVPISSEGQLLYDGMKKLQPGSKVLVSFDYDPPSAPELQPMAVAFIRYCFEHDIKVIIMGLWPQGPQQANLALAKILAEPEIKAKNLVYGVDYVNLGFQSGNEFVIQRMGSDFKSMFPTDYRGTPYDSLPLVRNITNYSGIDYSFNLSAGYPGTREWVLIAVDRFGLILGAGNTAVQTTGMYPYVRSGQLKGILGGMSGAAEIEELTGRLGKGAQFMVAQSFGHMVMVVFIVIGNVAYFLHERKKKRT
ncbi:hypothetical protein C3F09_02220 [candidate division GN15 bacterium]|uniref:Uncharacterized protein n=1 Tax=candidate division GN15 bacterium TaxID=2072418 RepID=A0A855X3K7_9BACT|nr:MAG: hypothetical protein C3F09_02220 [candidate division GN15 bacterium]